MASPQKGQKSASRWGFLQQAVASVESRLDTILAEEDEEDRKVAPVVPQPPKENVSSKKPSIEISRSGAGTPTNDRLQERLVRAMAKKAGSRPESPMPPSEPVSRAATPNNLALEEAVQVAPAAIERTMENQSEVNSNKKDGLDKPKVILAESKDNTTEGNSMKELNEARRVEEPGSNSLLVGAPPIELSSATGSPRPSTEALRERLSISSARPSTDSQLKEDQTVLHIQLEHEAAKTTMQEEINGYIERIDTLQAKLQYLTKEAVEAAKQAATDAKPGTVEKKLLEKDEKIALLMEEGQKLSITEMKHLATIKKLRSNNATIKKDHEATTTRAEKAEQSLRSMEDRARRAEIASKRAEQNSTASLAASSDFEALSKERNALNATLADIRAELTRANARADAAESKAQSEQIGKERRRNAELQDDLTSAKVERELAEEKFTREIRDLKASLEREKETSRSMETEMLGEQAALESKLESFRTRAEEASSGDHGDTQAKLLRQIETLQSQYAAASQNWQGIEGTLLSRITNLEKERDEVASREAELRKKLRDAALKARSLGRELEEAQHKSSDIEKVHADAEAERYRCAKRVQHLEGDLAAAQKDLEEQRQQSEREMVRRLDEEKSKWTAALHIQRNESPGTSLRKGSGLPYDGNHLMSPIHGNSRRPSVIPGHDSNTPPRLYSTTSIKAFANGAIAEIPSAIPGPDADEYFANMPPTPASQSHRGMHDLISTSTVGAGPSVQLVERMSANVRRLESEKAATKDEITRLTTQRDEARQEVVSFMREAEEKRNIDQQLQALEKEHKAMAERYQTTLELLGEKSEQVDELKADILDVKQMYRQLADTMK